MFSLDKRSLALFRIGLGFVILRDLIERAAAFRLHYTAEGIFTRYPPLGAYPHLSFHQISGSFAFQAAMFIAAGLAATGLMLGLWTRGCAAVSWILSLSLQHHAPMITYGADTVLRLALLWGMFLPLGERFALRLPVGIRGPYGGAENRVQSFAGAALLAQIAAIYFISGLHKSFDPAWRAGEGLRLALAATGTASGRWLGYVGALAVPLNYVVMGVQLIAPILLFAPTRARKLGILALVLLQAAMWDMLVLDLFPIVSIVALVALIPTESWEKTSRPGTPISRLPIHRSLVAAAILAGIVLPGASRRPETGRDASALERVLTASGLEQSWTMFSPPPRESVWIVSLARLSDGSMWDLGTQSAFRGWDDRAQITNAAYMRWAQLAWRHDENADTFKKLTSALCREGNRLEVTRQAPGTARTLVALVSAPTEGFAGSVQLRVKPLASSECYAK